MELSSVCIITFQPITVDIGTIVAVNIAKLCCDWLKFLRQDEITIVLSCDETLKGNKMVWANSKILYFLLKSRNLLKIWKKEEK